MTTDKRTPAQRNAEWWRDIYLRRNGTLATREVDSELAGKTWSQRHQAWRQLVELG